MLARLGAQHLYLLIRCHSSRLDGTLCPLPNRLDCRLVGEGCGVEGTTGLGFELMLERGLGRTCWLVFGGWYKRQMMARKFIKKR